MAFNGSGVFNRIYSWVTDAANGIDVSSTRTDTDTNDIASGLSNCICKDGQQTITANIPWSGFKITNLGLGTASTDAARIDNANGYSICEFRLTLTSGTPVTTGDVSSATTIYCSPYKGNRIALYDGTNWHMRNSSEFSIAVPAVANSVYDVFCYDSSGTPTLEVLVWTNTTTRATALTTQDGVLVKSGATTRRYLGTYMTDATGKTADTLAFRWLWNYYNRVRRPMFVTDSTASWTYTTATIRQANGNTANQLDFVVGWVEDAVTANSYVSVSNSTGGIGVQSGMGYDSITAFTTSQIGAPLTIATGAAGTKGLITSCVKLYPSVGRHYLSWLENSTATGTTTWVSASAAGLQGEIMA